MSAPQTDADVIVAGLVDAITDALVLCDEGTGYNLPELLRVALERVAGERGEGTYGLVEHRPGSWEATHITELAAMADWGPPL